MAGLLINLEQLELSISRIKSYCTTMYSTKDHTHDDKYYKKTEIDVFNSNLQTLISTKASTEHTHTSEDITKLTGYEKPSTTSAIAAADSLNTAIGKLEKALDNVSYESHNHDATYLKINATAAAAKQLESSRVISLGGAVNGSASFDGSSDITINTSIANISSDKITAMTGYVKPDTADAITVTDSLNVALGKIEKALDGKQVAGDYAAAVHDHSNLYYTKQEISDILAGIESGGSASLEAAKAYTDAAIDKITGEGVSDALDTLKELGDALNNDPDFAATITSGLAGKADKDHTHDEATVDAAGFMSAEDKAKLNGIAENANNYVHPTDAGNKHIPSGGESGQVLLWSADGDAEWGNITTTDQYVKNTLETTTVAYITGTTSDITGVGDQVFDTGVYLTTNAGELKAAKFVGDLDGTATKATTADTCTGNAATANVASKTKEAFSISLNGTSQGSFDGSEAISINITAASVGAPTIDKFNEATQQATNEEVETMLSQYFN